LKSGDYAFAISTKRCRWQSPSHDWPRSVVNQCLAWEIMREFSQCRKAPFPTPPTAQSDAKPNIPQLVEVMSLDEAIAAVHAQADFPFTMSHVLRIEHAEDVDVTVERFRRWLVARRNQQPMTFPNGAALCMKKGRAGRQDRNRAILRGLALKRLKDAGFTRRQAAEKLGMDDSALGRDDWKDLPKRAEAEITTRVTSIREGLKMGYTLRELETPLPQSFRVD
jgi:ribosomal protein L13E